MKIGFMGLGKLGLPCALVAEQKGHEVVGYDPSPDVQRYVAEKKIPYREEGAPEALLSSKIRTVSVKELVEFSDLIFVAVQTPHNPRFEGITRIPEERVDFDYTYLVDACKQLNAEIEKTGQDKVVVVISTVLPGTVDEYVRPHLGKHFKLCYNPFFIAMGTTMRDFQNPEFVLFGMADEQAADLAEKFYKTIHNAPFYRCSIKSAELIKVAYNTFISTKIAFVNHLMEVCHYTGADVDEVTDGIKLGTERLISTKYLTAGMGDGGGCHPRDNIALSWLAQKIGMTFDLPEAIMMAREQQTEFLANLVVEEALILNTVYWPGGKARDYRNLVAQKRILDRLPVVILGKAFKEQTNLTVGSPAILLKNILTEYGFSAEMYDPWVDEAEDKTVNPYASLPGKRVFFIGTRHEVFKGYKFPKGSVVIDPWRMIPDQEGVKVIRVGQAKKSA